MADLMRRFCKELSAQSQPAGQVLLIFLSLYSSFGILFPASVFTAAGFRPTLLMGLGYLVTSLSVVHLFQDDFSDGTLEWRLGQGYPLEPYVLVRMIAHWLHFGFPLTLLVGILAAFDPWPFIMGIALTTLTLTALGAVGSALCLHIPSGRFIMVPLLILPLGIPIMIVSMGFLANPSGNQWLCTAFQFGLFFMASGLSLIACPYALRLSLK